MKILAFFPAALLSFALLSGSASAERLLPSMNEARDAARSVGWEVARRNQSVQSVKVDSCEWKSQDRIHCLVIDRGSTSVMKTICRVGVNVTMRNEVARGTLWQVKCRNERLPLLRAPNALAAMQLQAQELSGHNESSISILARLSRVEMVGDAAWSPQGSPQKSEGELCSALLRVRLTPEGAIEVSTEKSGCTKIPDV